MSEKPVLYRSGFVAVVGRPNVGKSTLVNRLVGQKLAVVSSRPQTTRRKQLGILTMEKAQLIFVDTPGIHKPMHMLGEWMNQVAENSLTNADIILWVVDANASPTTEDNLVAERLSSLKKSIPKMMVLNKTDLISGDPILLNTRVIEYKNLLPSARSINISAMTGFQIEVLLKEILEYLPPGPLLYDEDQVTDMFEKDICADMLRESALLHLRDEVPHAIAVRIDEYTERGEEGAYIAATFLVERDSQKGIVIGRNGDMLKKIGTAARRSIEEMSGRRVYLDLRVKVNKNWRDNPDALRWLGYSEDNV